MASPEVAVPTPDDHVTESASGSIPVPGSSVSATDVTSSSAAAPSPAPSHTCASSGIHKPKIYKDGTVRYDHGFITVPSEPNSLHDALADF